MAFLSIRDLNVSYGNIKALKGISLDVEEGTIVTLIGANGAGKSTLMKTLSGLLKASKGSILLDGREIMNLPSHQIVKQGIILSPEGRQVFPQMTVYENLMMGAFTIQSKAEKAELLKTVYDLFPILEERSRQQAGTLSGGEQQMLAVGRAMMAKPRVLLLDEPSLGLAPLVIKEIFAMIQRINALGTTVLLVEQNARIALKVSDYAYVLETGNITLQGTGAELANNQRVKDAYLGG